MKQPSIMGTKENRARQRDMDKIYVHGIVQGLSQARDMALRRQGWSALGIARELEVMMNNLKEPTYE